MPISLAPKENNLPVSKPKSWMSSLRKPGVSTELLRHDTVVEDFKDESLGTFDV